MCVKILYNERGSVMSLIKKIQEFIKRNKEDDRGVVFQDNPRNITELFDYVGDKELRINYNDPINPYLQLKTVGGYERVLIGDRVKRSYHKGRRVFIIEKKEREQ